MISEQEKRFLIKSLNRILLLVWFIRFPALGNINDFTLKILQITSIKPFSIALPPSEQKIRAESGLFLIKVIINLNSLTIARKNLIIKLTNQIPKSLIYLKGIDLYITF